MICLFFDTETTGMVDWKAAPTAFHQPHVVQIGAILQCDTTRKIFGEINYVVKPTVGVSIPEDAAKIHGITNEIAERFGVNKFTAISAFSHLALRADCLVAHNADFDLRMLACEKARTGLDWGEKKSFCTMHATTPLVQIPSPNYPGQFKWPKLQEGDLYFWLSERKAVAA